MESSSKTAVRDKMFTVKLEPEDPSEDSFERETDIEIPFVFAAHGAQSDEEIEIQVDEKAPHRSSIRHAPVIRESKTKAKAKGAGNQLRGCFSFKKDDRPVVHRCVSKISIEDYRRRRARMAKPIGQPRVPDSVPKKEVRFASDVFVVFSSDDEMEEGDEKGGKESSVDVLEPLLPSSSPKSMKLNPAVKAEGQHAGSSVENDDKKMWFCTVCNNNYVQKHKNAHLKTQLHATMLDLAFRLSSQVPVIKPITKMWLCVVCNKEYSRTNKNVHLRTQRHQKKLEENIQNNNLK